VVKNFFIQEQHHLHNLKEHFQQALSQPLMTAMTAVGQKTVPLTGKVFFSGVWAKIIHEKNLK
jgi:hypothetical protein